MPKMEVLRDRSEKTNTTKILEQMPEKIYIYKMNILRKMAEQTDSSDKIIEQIQEKTRSKKYSYDDTKDVMLQEGMNFDVEVSKWKSNNKEKLLQATILEENVIKIPAITHTIYFFNSESGSSLSKTDIQKINNTSSKLSNVDPSYQHFFWTNFQELVPDSIRKINNLTVKTIEEFSSDKLWNNLIEILDRGLVKKGWFTSASDILRILVVQKYGGIYHDTDYEIYNANKVIAYNKMFNFYLGQERPWNDFLMGNAFFASSPDHPIINTATDLLHRNLNPEEYSNVPEYILHPYASSHKILMGTGPIMLSVAYFKANNIDSNQDVVMEAKYFYNTDYARGLAKDSRCYKPIPDEEIQYLSGIVIGADMLCGSWGDSL